MCGLLVLAAIALAWPAAAAGHSAFVGSDPEPGARLDDSPRALALEFTEPLNRRLSTVKLLRVAGGERIAAEVRPTSARRLQLIPGQPLPRGAYRVEWHTVSTEDGHALEGSYSFGVRAPAVGGEHSVEQSPFARAGWLRVVLRGLLYVFGLGLAAALLLPLLTRISHWPVPDGVVTTELTAAARDRHQRLVEVLGGLAVLAAVGATLAEAFDAAGSLSPSRLADFLLANQAGAARVLVVMLFLGPALLWRRRPRASALLAVLALGAIAASGHASSAAPRIPSVLNDWLHLVSAATWLGGIGWLVAVWTPTLRGGNVGDRIAVARDVLPAFGRVALPAFAVATATGLVSLVTQLGHLDALWRTDYGRVLAFKVALVGVIAVLSALHAFRLRPRMLAANPHPDPRLERRHWWLLRAEPVLGLGVIAAVGLLVAFPLPPRQLGDADEAEAATQSACDPCPLRKPGDAELAVADRAGRQLVAAWIRRDADAITGTVRVLDYRGRPPRVPLRVLDATVRSCGVGCQEFRGSAQQRVISVAVRDSGRRYVVALPATWRQRASGRARRLLREAEAAMRRLGSVRESEQVTSGPGSYAATDYWFRAPKRMRYRTNAGGETVIVGSRQWLRSSGERWQPSRYGSGLAFRTRSWFRWSNYARAVRLLGVRAAGGRRLAELALMDEGTPVWFRLSIDLGTHRVVAEQMAAKGHFIRSRFFAFNRPVHIAPPRDR